VGCAASNLVAASTGSSAAATSASNAGANGAAHAAAHSAAAGAASNAATSASNASANGAAHAAASSAAASGATSSANVATSTSGAGANGAAHAAANSAAVSAAGSPPGAVNSGSVPPVLVQSGWAPSGLQPNAAPPPAVLAGASGAPLAIIQVGDAAPARDVYQPASPAIIVLGGGPPASGDGSSQPSTQTAQNAPVSNADDGSTKIEATARGSRGGSEQQQRVMSALNSGLLEYSRSGTIVRKGEILALSPTLASLTTARRLGYTMVERLPLKDLGLSAVVLRAPTDLTADQALGRLQAADPRGGYSLNPIYTTTGEIGPTARSAASPVRRPVSTRDAAVGLIDTGVFLQHPALAQARLEQQGFAPGGLTPAKHGTAVASIAAGQAGDFHGVAPGSRIYVADVYGKTGAGGAASSVAEGIDWLVRKGAPVINISLVGPPNKLMEAAVEAAIRKGVIVVAAVGNDGPSSPPLYPAAYGGVLAVTGVDQNNHILLEAVRSTQVAFAAPGADIFAADGTAGFAKVRGTSFAAPIVAGQLALAHRRMDGRDADAAVRGLKHAARPPAATDAAYGFGIVGEDARLALRPGLSQITTAETEPSERSKE
jgi:hypothetical protein